MEAVITDHCRRWNTVNAGAGSKCFNMYIAPTRTRGVTRHNRLPCFRFIYRCCHSARTRTRTRNSPLPCFRFIDRCHC